LKGFYDWKLWDGGFPNHPPLISALYFIIYPLHSKLMWFLSNLGNFIALHRLAPTKFLWLFDFAKWFGQNLHGTSSYLSGIIVILKQFMIWADLAIGGVIYWVSKKAKVNWKKPVLIYLLLPFSWYLSSSWGQSDQLSFLFLIIAFILLTSKKYCGLSPLIYVIAANLKPNCVLLLPIFLYVWYKQKNSLKKLILGGIVAVIFTFWTISWFTDQNVFNYAFTVVAKRMSTSDGLINYDAFNFWYIFYPYHKPFVLDTNFYWIMTAKYWGWFMILVTSILSLKVIKKDRLETIFAAMFIAGLGIYMFMTGMHDRYAFLAIVPLFLFSIYKRKYFKYFLIMSTIYTLNLFLAYSPWEIVLEIKKILELNNFLVARILSFVNLIFYIRVTYLILKEKK
jgi:Gpi18-like mannosyltransferase